LKIGIVGAGAIGGYAGTKLSLAGNDVTFIARGKNLEAIGRDGMRLIEADGRESINRNGIVTEDYQGAGPQQLVILAVKAYQLANVADRIAPMLDADTPIVTMQNGIPYWYFSRHSGAFEAGRELEVDALLGSVIELARLTQTPTPHLDAVYALCKRLATQILGTKS